MGTGTHTLVVIVLLVVGWWRRRWWPAHGCSGACFLGGWAARTSVVGLFVDGRCVFFCCLCGGWRAAGEHGALLPVESGMECGGLAEGVVPLCPGRVVQKGARQVVGIITHHSDHFNTHQPRPGGCPEHTQKPKKRVGLFLLGEPITCTMLPFSLSTKMTPSLQKTKSSPSLNHTKN